MLTFSSRGGLARDSCRTFVSAAFDGIHQTLRLIQTKQYSSRGICMVRRA
jgi:hypothetical protein